MRGVIFKKKMVSHIVWLKVGVNLLWGSYEAFSSIG